MLRFCVFWKHPPKSQNCLKSFQASFVNCWQIIFQCERCQGVLKINGLKHRIPNKSLVGRNYLNILKPKWLFLCLLLLLLNTNVLLFIIIVSNWKISLNFYNNYVFLYSFLELLQGSSEEFQGPLNHSATDAW